MRIAFEHAPPFACESCLTAKIFATTPAPTVRPPSRIAKRRPSSIAIGAIRRHHHLHVVARHHHLDAFRQLARTRHVRRAEVELRAVALEERRMTTAFFLRQHVHLRLELRVRRDRCPACTAPGRARRRRASCRAAAAGVVACLALVEQLAEHLDARAPSSSPSGLMPTISISSPTLTTPRSIRPVTTVPRPEIENTSSTGIRNGFSMSRCGSGIHAIQRIDQLDDRSARRFRTGRLPAPSAPNP